MRDSKVLDGPQLALAPQAWAGFVSYARGVQSPRHALLAAAWEAAR